VPLPGDRLIDDLSTAIKVAGIGFAIMTGHAVLACASLKSLLHDELVKITVKAFGAGMDALVNPSTPTKPVSETDAEIGYWQRISRVLDDRLEPLLSGPDPQDDDGLAMLRKLESHDAIAEAVERPASGPTAV
jgi:hypothetical protein